MSDHVYKTVEITGSSSAGIQDAIETAVAKAAVTLRHLDALARRQRLAALLVDLAAHKRMSVNSTLEEMLLHTNDGVGPHTKSQLRYIEELKKKHGIDYDSHGSYRFVED